MSLMGAYSDVASTLPRKCLVDYVWDLFTFHDVPHAQERVGQAQSWYSSRCVSCHGHVRISFAIRRSGSISGANPSMSAH